jgi:hypothetical protein
VYGAARQCGIAAATTCCYKKYSLACSGSFPSCGVICYSHQLMCPKASLVGGAESSWLATHNSVGRTQLLWFTCMLWYGAAVLPLSAALVGRGADGVDAMA